jgi:Trypsin-like peptidase domain
MKRISTVVLIVITLVINSISPANAAVTWSQTSTLDVGYFGDNSQYDLNYVSAYIFDDDPDLINFYLEFAKIPTTKMFNDGKESFGVVSLDFNLDGTFDYRLYITDVDLTIDRSAVKGLAMSVVNGISTYTNCDVSVFTNIAENQKWVGLAVSRSCIGLPKTFDLIGTTNYSSGASGDSVPLNRMRVNLPTAISGGSSSTTFPNVGATFTLPTTKANESEAANSYSDSPQDLSKLSEDLLPSVVTVQCSGGSGTGWSADVAMSTDLQTAGYKSLVITNHHVIESCLASKSVTLVLNSKTSLPGVIVSWSKNDDIAGIAVQTTIPALQWIGTNPKQGWWVGVLGSPLGVSGILTTGIISSTNSIASRFTFTAAINPGNSGGPVFDNTGRVMGLATSKNLISTDSLAEGFGNAQGTPLLCSVIISCTIEKNPWNATPKFAAASSLIDKAAAEAAAKIAQDKAVADAKAAAEAAAKIAQDKAVADAKAAAEAAAKIALDKALTEARAEAKVAEAAAKLAQEISASENRTTSDLLAKLQNDFSNLSANYANYLNKYNEATSQIEFLQGVVKALQEQVTALLKPKSETIVCTKGSAFKVVKGITPKCPVGYKRN